VETPFLSAIESTWGNDFTQTELHTAEPLLRDPSTFEVQIAIEKLKRHKSPSIDQITAELMKSWG
jgi:hypothetical protein